MNETLPVVSDLSQHFGISPTAVMLDQRLSNGATRLYAVLDARLCGRPQRIRIETLAADLGWSERAVKRCAAELRAAGWLAAGRTGRSNMWHLVNPVRRARSVPADGTKMALPQINRSLSTTNSRAVIEEPPAPTSEAPLCDEPQTIHEHLKAAQEAAQTTIRATRKVRESLARIKQQQIAPEALAALVAAYKAAHRARIENPAGWLVWVLEDLAAGGRPETPKPTYQQQPLYLDRPLTEPCEHGEPRGQHACALCRHARKPVTA